MADDLFIDPEVEIYGSRKEWVSKTEVIPIDEVGEPHPMGEWVLYDLNDYRDFNCARYEACLTHARDRNWVGYSCSRCPHLKTTVPSVPDDPGEGYQRSEEDGTFFIHPRYRFESSSSDVCECGNRRCEGDDMCVECEEELGRVMSGWYD